MLIMKNAQSELVAIGPVPIEYQAAMLRDEIEESSDWTSVGIARVLTEAQARATDDTGYTQTAVQAPPPPNGATGYPSITATVRS